jgi:hypothetical protein
MYRKSLVLLVAILYYACAATKDLNVYKDLTYQIASFGNSVQHDGLTVTTERRADGLFSYGYYAYSLDAVPFTSATITKCELIFSSTGVVTSEDTDLTINRLMPTLWSESTGENDLPQIFDQIGSVVFKPDGTSNALDITDACKYYLNQKAVEISLATYVTGTSGKVVVASHDVNPSSSLIRVTYTETDTTSAPTTASTTAPTTASTSTPTTSSSSAPSAPSTTQSTGSTATPGTPTTRGPTSAPGTPTTKTPSTTIAVNQRSNAHSLQVGTIGALLLALIVICM